MPLFVVIQSGTAAGHAVALRGVVARIGSAADCEVRIPAEAGVEPVAVNLELRGKACYLFNVLTRPLHLGPVVVPPGQAAAWPVGQPLKLNDQVTLGLEERAAAPVVPVRRTQPTTTMPGATAPAADPVSEEKPVAKNNGAKILGIILCLLVAVALVFWDVDLGKPPPLAEAGPDFNTVQAGLVELEKRTTSADDARWLARWREELQIARQAQGRGATEQSKGLYLRLYEKGEGWAARWGTIPEEGQAAMKFLKGELNRIQQAASRE